MRGQEYTVMNYLVWAVFAAMFAGIVMVVASKLSTPMQPVFMKETKNVFVSAYRSAVTSLSCSCASSNGVIAYSSGFQLTQKLVQAMLSDPSVQVQFYGGTGFRTPSDHSSILAKRSVKATLVVCCDYSKRCNAYFNLPGEHSCN